MWQQLLYEPQQRFFLPKRAFRPPNQSRLFLHFGALQQVLQPVLQQVVGAGAQQVGAQAAGAGAQQTGAAAGAQQLGAAGAQQGAAAGAAQDGAGAQQLGAGQQPLCLPKPASTVVKLARHTNTAEIHANFISKLLKISVTKGT